ncbi:MAG: hypothetical protein MHM6MM_004637 [Cercozoa sp. M6MM]
MSAWKQGFATGMFATGPVTCLYGFCCMPCANGQVVSAAEQGTDTPWIFNCCCVGPAKARNIVRTSKGLEGDWKTDCLLGGCLGCCSTVQLLQELDQTGPDLEVMKKM